MPLGVRCVSPSKLVMPQGVVCLVVQVGGCCQQHGFHLMAARADAGLPLAAQTRLWAS